MAPLFHFMDEKKTELVFGIDNMPAHWVHDIPGLGRTEGNSFTRNSRYNHTTPVRLTIDQAKLATRNKIVPLDGELIFRQTASYRAADGHRDRLMNAKHSPMAEEFVVGDIKNLHTVVTSVMIMQTATWLSSSKLLDLVADVTGYCSKWFIPVTFHPKVQERLDEIQRDHEMYDQEDEIDEAAPSDKHRETAFYHGTPTTAAAKAIMKSGLKGQEVQGKGQLAPVAGRAYLSQQLRYAIIYAIGGDYLGHKAHPSMIEADPYGYVMVMDGSALEDIQPDEDSVGQFLYDNSKAGRYSGDPADTMRQRVWNYIYQSVTDNQRRQIMGGMYAYFASGGKKALKSMPDSIKHWLIDNGAHVAATGKIMPKEVWRIDKRKTEKLAKDGSNFFEIAKRVK